VENKCGTHHEFDKIDRYLIFIFFYNGNLDYDKPVAYRENFAPIQGVSAKTFEPNNSVIFQQIFVKFKMQIV
jgi:hypothetical protein